MRQRTRKFLAGLLSLGMLLQAASPLSALAADSSASTEAELRITAEGQTYEVGQDGRYVEITSKQGYEHASIQYSGNSASRCYIIYGSLPENTLVEGIGENRPDVEMMSYNGSDLSFGELEFKNLGNVQLSGVVGGSLKVENAGNVDVGLVGFSNGLVGGSLTLTNVGNVRTCQVAGTVTITNAEDVVMIGDLSTTDSFFRGSNNTITAKSLEVKSTDAGAIGQISFTRTDTESAYRIIRGESADDNTQTAMQGATFSESSVSEKYLCIQPGTPEAQPEPELTVTFQKYQEDTVYTAEITPKTKKFTLDGQTVEVEYAGGTYTFTGKLGEMRGDTYGDKITLTGTDTVHPDVVWESSNDREIVTGTLTVDKVNNFTSDEIDGNIELTCDGDVTIEARYYAVLGRLTVKSAQNVTLRSTQATGHFVAGQAYITCSGKVTMRNEGKGWLTHMGSISVDGAPSGVELYCHDSEYISNSIKIKDCSGDVSIINETGAAAQYQMVVDSPNAQSVVIKGSFDKDIQINCGGDVSINGTIRMEGVADDKFSEISGKNVTIDSGSEPAAEGNLKVTADTIDIKGGGDILLSGRETYLNSRALRVENSAGGKLAKTLGYVYTGAETGYRADKTAMNTNDVYRYEANSEETFVNGNASYLRAGPDSPVFPNEMQDNIWKAPNANTYQDELKITINDTDYTFDQSIGDSGKTIDDNGTKVKVSYDSAQQSYVITGKLGDNVVIAGMENNGAYPNLSVDLQGRSNGIVRAEGVNDLKLTSASSVAISNSTKIYGDLKLEANGSIWMGGQVAGKMTITGGAGCNDIYMQPMASASGYIAESIEVDAPAAEQFRIFGYCSYNKPITRDGITVTAKKVLLEAVSYGLVGTVTFRAPDSNYYVAYTDSGKKNQIEVPNNTDITSDYLLVEEGTPPEPPVVKEYPSLTIQVGDTTSEITTDGTDITLTPEIPGILSERCVLYDTATNTFEIYSTSFYTTSGNEYAVQFTGVADDSGRKPNLSIEYSNGSIVQLGGLAVTGVHDFKAVASIANVAEKLMIEADGEVSLESSDSPAKDMDITSEGLTIKTYVGGIGNLKFTQASTGEYKSYTDEDKSNSTDKLPDGSAVGGSYLRIEKTSDNPGGNTGGDDNKPDKPDDKPDKPNDPTKPDDNPSDPDDSGKDDPGSTDDPIIDPGQTSEDSEFGGAIAAAIVGGTAIWGGYEIITRVMLRTLLPEGAAIPTNRAQLAVLAWNAAGRPEPVQAPVFADVADAETARAAQWCVEQGILSAEDDTFNPDSWMPKFKVIEVWKTAFPG